MIKQNKFIIFNILLILASGRDRLPIIGAYILFLAKTSSGQQTFLNTLNLALIYLIMFIVLIHEKWHLISVL